MATRSAARKPRIAFVASPSAKAREAATLLIGRYGDTPLDDAELIVALGGEASCCARCTIISIAGCPSMG
jgi:NAD+ kinase